MLEPDEGAVLEAAALPPEPREAFRREVARRLKEARRERTLTQRQLAELGASTQQNISRYEKGFIPDSWFLLARMHVEKAIDLNWLLGFRSAAEAAEPVAGRESLRSAGAAAAAGLQRLEPALPGRGEAPARALAAAAAPRASGGSPAELLVAGSDVPEERAPAESGAVRAAADPEAGL